MTSCNWVEMRGRSVAAANHAPDHYGQEVPTLAN